MSLPVVMLLIPINQLLLLLAFHLIPETCNAMIRADDLAMVVHSLRWKQVSLLRTPDALNITKALSALEIGTSVGNDNKERAVVFEERHMLDLLKERSRPASSILLVKADLDWPRLEEHLSGFFYSRSVIASDLKTTREYQTFRDQNVVSTRTLLANGSWTKYDLKGAAVRVICGNWKVEKSLPSSTLNNCSLVFSPGSASTPAAPQARTAPPLG